MIFKICNCREVFVEKCCESYEILVDNSCKFTNETDEQSWKPVFFGNGPHPESYKLEIGIPVCLRRQKWPIYHNGTDRLVMLSDGTLRHYIIHDPEIPDYDLDEETLFYEYKQGFYCMDKKVDSKTGVVLKLAIVCVPKVNGGWNDLEWRMRNIVDPALHCISIAAFISVSIVHFVLPQLRDMVGNIMTTVCICLTVSQAADIVTIFTELNSPLSYITADVVMFMSVLSAFLWLTSLGFYIWKTFRSRNVFLRITDGRKYCYYSYGIWTATAIISLTAIFAHFMLDIPSTLSIKSSQGTAVGWLGVAVFFLPIACCIFLIIYFYLSTLQIMNNMASCGRIHHKLKYCFEMFVKTAVILIIGWISFVISWIPYNSLFYIHIFINGLQGPLIFYICVISQRRIRYLLRRVCCSEKCICSCCRPDRTNDGPEWGEEMMAMNQ
ncbi:hypothetical protein O3M35_003737 [Rhynocoris fuscipes]